MKNSEPSKNPEPLLTVASGSGTGRWVLPWNYVGGGTEAAKDNDGGLFLLGCLFFWIPPLCLLFLSLAERKGWRRQLQLFGYREYGPDTTQYGLWQQHPVTKRWVLTQPLS